MAYLVELTAPRVVNVRDYLTSEPRCWRSAGSNPLLRHLGRHRTCFLPWHQSLSRQAMGSRGCALPVRGSRRLHYPVTDWGYSEVGEIERSVLRSPSLDLGEVVWGMWGHRSHAVVPAERLRGQALPDGMDPMAGTFARVGAVALNAVLASRACVGETVVVFGLGVIGLLTTQLLVSQGVDVIAIDTVSHRLELAEKFGAMSLVRDTG